VNAVLFDFNLVPRCLVSEVLGRGLDGWVLGLSLEGWDLGLEACVLDSINATADHADDRYALAVMLCFYVVYRVPASDPYGSCTGNRYDWLTCGTPLGCRRWP